MLQSHPVMQRWFTFILICCLFVNNKDLRCIFPAVLHHSCCTIYLHPLDKPTTGVCDTHSSLIGHLCSSYDRVLDMTLYEWFQTAELLLQVCCWAGLPGEWARALRRPLWQERLCQHLSVRLLALCLAQLRLPRSSMQALNETLAPHLKNKKRAFHGDRQLPGLSYHAQIRQFTKLAPLSSLTNTRRNNHPTLKMFSIL